MAIVGALCAIFVVLAGFVAGSTAVLAGLAITAVLLGVAWWMTGRRWRAWGYAERERELVIKRGVWVRYQSIVPYGRMQFIELKQGPFDRILGTYELQLHTAAAATDARIPLLPEAEANRLRQRLTELGEAYAAGI